MAAVICYKDQNSPLYQRADALEGTAQVARVHGSDIQGRWVRADLYIPSIYTQTRFRGEKKQAKQLAHRPGSAEGADTVSCLPLPGPDLRLRPESTEACEPAAVKKEIHCSVTAGLPVFISSILHWG